MSITPRRRPRPEARPSLDPDVNARRMGWTELPMVGGLHYMWWQGGMYLIYVLYDETITRIVGFTLHNANEVHDLKTNALYLKHVYPKPPGH